MKKLWIILLLALYVMCTYYFLFEDSLKCGISSVVLLICFYGEKLNR